MRAELDLAIAAARAAGAITLECYNGQYPVRDKAPDDPLTSADLAADACLREMLLGGRPDCGWLSEETADRPDRLTRERVWIVDPLDGTREFVSRIPEYAVSIALVEQGTPVVGVVYNPPTGELFAAVRDGGTYLNGKRVFCSATDRLDRAVLITSRSETGRGQVEPFRSRVGQVRPVGSVAYKLALVAAGLGDLNVSVRPKNEWDVCAGDLLVCEAGGRMLDLEGRFRRYNQRDPLIHGGLVAGPSALVFPMLDLVREAG